MKVIGFTEVFYTLWEVGDVYNENIYNYGAVIGTVSKQSVTYLKNLSIDFEKAKSKLAGEKYDIDLELRGHSSFTRTIGEAEYIDWGKYLPVTAFSFGKMKGAAFAEATDLWQLKRAMKEEKSARRRALARRRLIDLGEVVKYTWNEPVWQPLNDDLKDERGSWIQVKRKYATKDQIAEFRIKEMEGHHFTNGEKVILEVKELKRFGFEGAYGWSSVVIYETKCGKIVKYIGGSPLTLRTETQLRLEKLSAELEKSIVRQCNLTEKQNLDNEVTFNKLDEIDIQIRQIELDSNKPEWCKIQATIKHDSYRGPETKLIRIKQLFK